MTERIQDPVSGEETTGHEWNGITELDTPVPKFFIGWYGLSINAALLLCILLPAIPLVTTFTTGLSGYTERGAVERQLSEALAQQGNWKTRMADLDAGEIAADPALRTIALAGGRAAFKTNCVACHGEQGRGQTGYPNLTDTVWNWGGSLEAIVETLEVGINTSHDDTRSGEMLAFGDDEVLEPNQIADSVAFVRSLSSLSHDAAAAARGKALFVENCASCHGETGAGNQELGAPNLTDTVWLYGSSTEAITQTIRHGRMGQMPHWSDRLDPETIKMLAVYVKSLSGGL